MEPSPQHRPPPEVLERGWREMAAVDRALQGGEIDESGWFRRMQELVVPAYLGADTVYGGSGHSGPAARWENARRLIVGALHKNGSLLDVGCANGLLMESLAAWALEDGLRIEPHGLELSPELAEVARRRLPHWADRIHLGNVLHWTPPRQYTFVRTNLDYVPAPRRPELVQRILDTFLEPGGRLLLGVVNEERASGLTAQLQRWGFYFGGVVEGDHPDPRVKRRVVWLEL